MDEIKKQTRIVNATTGEVIFDEEEQMDLYLFTEKGYLLHNNRSSGVKVMHRIEWPITVLDRSKWMALLPYIGKDNALMRKDRSKHPLTVQLIGPIIELSENKAYQWMKRMRDTNMVRKIDGFFYVNPMYMMATNRLSPDLYRIFEDQLKEHVPGWITDKYKELRQSE